MKPLYCISLFLLLILDSNAQPDTLLRDRYVDKYRRNREQYYVLKEDKSIKHGTYIKYYKGSSHYNIFETGRYRNNKKEGLWRFFYDDFPADQGESQGYFRNDLRDGQWEFFYFIRENDNNFDSKRVIQNKVAKDEYSIDISITGPRKYSGTLSDNERTGIWNYYDTRENLILAIDHSNDSVTFINPGKMPVNDSCGIYRPFFLGGKEYLNTMTHRKSLKEVDRIGEIVYSLIVDKKPTNSKLSIVSNTSSKKAGEAIAGRLATVMNDWVPKINNGKAETAEIRIIVMITSQHFSTNYMSGSYAANISGDFFQFHIDYK